MPDIFDEVAEDLRAERTRGLLRRYGGLLIVAAVLVVVGVGAWEAYKAYETKRVSAAATSFLVAARQAEGPPGAQRDEALATLTTLAQNAPGGYRTLARLRAANLQADAGNMSAAAALWDQVAADGGTSKLLRDLATLTWARRTLDAGDPAIIAARLKPLTLPDNAWHAMAQECLALLAIRQGDMATARDTLKRLGEDTTAPDGVRGRANGLLGRLGA